MRTLVLGDLHLSSHTPKGVERDLERVLDAHGGSCVIFAGDFFDLSAEAGKARDLASGFEAHPVAHAALSRHVERGGEIVFLAGNHDPEIASVGQFFPRGVRVSPWFFREGGLHVEHGHLYDPDNAPAHPLASARGTLGVHFVEEFIAKTGAFAYLNANDKTPLELFWNAFRWYGRRGPFVVYTYFEAAFAALAKSGPFYTPESHTNLEAFLEDAGVDEATARALMDERATPTMTSLRDTIARLYLDRVTATVSILAGLSAFAIGRRKLAAVLGAAGLAGLVWSWSRGHDRYGGKVPARLDAAADRVRRAVGADLVVFGHAHEIADRDGYANTASFAFPRGVPGRPFLEIANGRAERRFLSGVL